MSYPVGPRSTVTRREPPKSAAAREARAWVARLASRETTPRQLERFEAWLSDHPSHRPAFDEARALWLDVARLDVEGGQPSPPGRPGRRRPIPALRRAAPIAAAVLVASGAAAFAAENWTAWTSDVAAGEGTRTLRLPDGSTAVLDAGAAIDLAYTPDQRTIRLKQGQAWFSVRPDATRPFVVETGALTARAAVAGYAVRKSAGGDQVTVLNGRVAVAGPGDPTAVLVQSGVTRAYRKASTGDHVARDAETAWRDGRLVLDGLTVREAIAELDRYRPGRLIVLAAPEGPVNAAFFLGDLDRGLDGLAASQGLTLTRVLPGVTVVTTRRAPGA